MEMFVMTSVNVVDSANEGKFINPCVAHFLNDTIFNLWAQGKVSSFFLKFKMGHSKSLVLKLLGVPSVFFFLASGLVLSHQICD